MFNRFFGQTIACARRNQASLNVCVSSLDTVEVISYHLHLGRLDILLLMLLLMLAMLATASHMRISYFFCVALLWHQI